MMYAMNRKRESGTVLILKNISGAIIQQDDAPAHNEKLHKNWLRRSINGFWEEGTWQQTLQT